MFAWSPCVFVPGSGTTVIWEKHALESPLFFNEWAKEREKKMSTFVNVTTVSLFLIRKLMSMQPEAGGL